MMARNKAERFGAGKSTRMNEAELTERERRELWAEKQIKAAKRAWRVAGYVLAILAAAFIYWIVWESGFIAGFREGNESAERMTP